MICLFMNAVFSSVEMAFVTIGKTALRRRAKTGDANAQTLLKLRENPERALSVIQVGITLVGAISAAIGGAGAQEKLAPRLQSAFHLSKNSAEGVAIACVVLVLTYFSVVVGELVPKTIALRFPLQVLSFGAGLLNRGSQIFGPLVSLFEFSTRWLVRLILPSPFNQLREMSSTAELDLASLSKHQRQYILNLANIEAKKVKDVLLPWTQVEWINAASDFTDVIRHVIDSGHTRMPVFNGIKLEGILHSKEFLAFTSSGNRDWRTILRPAIEIRPHDDLLNVLRLLQENKRHMAIVVDQENVLGLITLEDIIEEVIGDIFDEDDDGRVKSLLRQRAQARQPEI